MCDTGSEKDDPRHPDFFKNLADDLAALLTVQTARDLRNEATCFVINAGLDASKAKWRRWINEYSSNPDAALYSLQTMSLNAIFGWWTEPARVFHLSQDLYRLLHVTWAYRNSILASRFDAELPHTPGMVSSNAIGTYFAGNLERSLDGKPMILPNDDLVESGRQWLKRLRRKFASRNFHAIGPALDTPTDEAWIPALLDLLPKGPGKPKRRP